MEPPLSNPHPDRFFAELDRSVRVGRRAEALAAAAERLPCERCGSTAIPVVRKPTRLSYQWWDDPLPYVACRECGRYLVRLPVSFSYPAWFVADRRTGF